MDNHTPTQNPTTPGWLNSPYVTAAILLVIGVFYLVTVVNGHYWNGDFAHYLHPAENLAQGKNYLDTQYLLNSFGVFVGPYAYPPVYPLLLTPAIWLAGVDLVVLKWVGNCFFVAAMWLALKCFRPRLGSAILFPILLAAINPYIWGFRNNLLSDFPFLFFCFLSLFLMLEFFNKDESGHLTFPRRLLYAAAIGVSCYLCYGTREIGIVTPLTFIAYDIVCRRKVSLAAVVVVAVFVLLAYVQGQALSGTFVPEHIQDNLNALVHQDNATTINHLTWINLDPAQILDRVIGYRHSLQNYWIYYLGDDNPALTIIYKISFNVTMLLAVIGYVLCLFRKITVLEIFCAGYMATLLLFGAPPWLRYLIPIFPIFLYYTFLAIQWLVSLWRKQYAGGIALAWFLATFVLFSAQLNNIPYTPIEKGVYNPQTLEMFDFIRNNTQPDDTMVFARPRVMSLFTGRVSAAYPNQHHQTVEELNAYFEAIEGDYYIDMDLQDWMMPLNDRPAPGPRFRKVFSNTYFAVYRYTGAE